MKDTKTIAELDTYIFVDTSNIRTSCFKTLGLRIDFRRMLNYFKKKYPNLKDVRYYEGISNDDEYKRKLFKQLEKAGYTMCSLERKSYVDPAVYKKIKCKKCGNIQKEKVLGRSVKMKSNVDVYLATDLLEVAYLAQKPIHIILVSCDGDYAEMIKNAILKNENVSVSVLATPPVRQISRNTLSVRLRQLRGQVPRYQLTNIAVIGDMIKMNSPRKGSHT